MKKKTAGNRATEAQARAYFKDAYEIYDEGHDWEWPPMSSCKKARQVDGRKCTNAASYGRQSS